MTEERTTTRTWTVGEVAERFGVTVRTLHHYDRVGLLAPSGRTAAGYRLYDEDDLTRLQHVVVLRRLEVPLDEIAALLESGDTVGQLRRQRDRVRSRLGELQELADAIDTALERAVNEEQPSDAEMRELFGDAFDETYAEEAEQRWGETDAWAETQRRTASFTRADWEDVKAEQDAVTARLAEVFRSGAEPGSAEAGEAAEAHRASIQRFYDCDHAMHRRMACLYVDDPRFAATYDAVEPGLARWTHDAIRANADRAEEGRDVSGHTSGP